MDRQKLEEAVETFMGLVETEYFVGYRKDFKTALKVLQDLRDGKIGYLATSEEIKKAIVMNGHDVMTTDGYSNTNLRMVVIRDLVHTLTGKVQNNFEKQCIDESGVVSKKAWKELGKYKRKKPQGNIGREE